MEHKTIKLPRIMLDELDKYLDENQRLGYSSSAEFLKEYIRKVLETDAKKKKS